jgi:hypothetical protein
MVDGRFTKKTKQNLVKQLELVKRLFRNQCETRSWFLVWSIVSFNSLKPKLV